MDELGITLHYVSKLYFDRGISPSYSCLYVGQVDLRQVFILIKFSFSLDVDIDGPGQSDSLHLGTRY